MYTAPTAPLSIGGVLDDGVRLYRDSWRQLYKLAFLTALVVNVPQFLMTGGLPAGAVARSQVPALVWIMLITNLLVLCVLYPALVVKVDGIAKAVPVSDANALKAGLKRSPVVLLAYLLTTLAIGGGLILLVIPGIYAMVAVSLMLFTVVVEGRGPVAGLRASAELVRGAWWRTATLVTIAGIIAAVPTIAVGFVLGIISGLFAGSSAASAARMVGLLVYVVLSAFILPVALTLLYGVYRDRLLRKSGSDLEAKLAAVAAT